MMTVKFVAYVVKNEFVTKDGTNKNESKIHPASPLH